MEKIPNYLKAEEDKNIMILTYIQTKINESQKYIKKYSKEHSILEKMENNESYFHAFLKLSKKRQQDNVNNNTDDFRSLI